MDARAIWTAPDDLGITIPLLFSLVEQYSERRGRELYEDATAGALAHHDPKSIGELRGGSEATQADPDSEFESAPWKNLT